MRFASKLSPPQPNQVTSLDLPQGDFFLLRGIFRFRKSKDLLAKRKHYSAHPKGFQRKKSPYRGSKYFFHEETGVVPIETSFRGKGTTMPRIQTYFERSAAR